jgi:hypothetical protein
MTVGILCSLHGGIEAPIERRMLAGGGGGENDVLVQVIGDESRSRFGRT